VAVESGKSVKDPEVVELELQDGSRVPLQVKQVRHSGWNKARRETFLAVLAQTCNVRLAARLAGMRDKAPYDLRKRDPAFAALWQEALVIGYDRLESGLVAHALTGINAIEISELEPRDVPDEGVPGIAQDGAVTREGIDLALTLLKLHRASATGRPGRYRAKIATAEETDAALLKQLDRLAAKLAKVDAAEPTA
jgi:hypothetical protein